VTTQGVLLFPLSLAEARNNGAVAPRLQDFVTVELVRTEDVSSSIKHRTEDEKCAHRNSANLLRFCGWTNGCTYGCS
jgi:hypothetical protein